MLVSVEQVQQRIKEWAVGVDPEIEVQVLPPHENPREKGEILPVRLARHGHQMTVGFAESSFAGTHLTEATRETLHQVVRLLRYMEARGLSRPRQDG